MEPALGTAAAITLPSALATLRALVKAASTTSRDSLSAHRAVSEAMGTDLQLVQVLTTITDSIHSVLRTHD